MNNFGSLIQGERKLLSSQLNICCLFTKYSDAFPCIAMKIEIYSRWKLSFYYTIYGRQYLVLYEWKSIFSVQCCKTGNSMMLFNGRYMRRLFILEFRIMSLWWTKTKRLIPECANYLSYNYKNAKCALIFVYYNF